jgi:heme exporter protein B
MDRTSPAAAAMLMYRRDLLLAFRHWDQVAQPVVFFAMVTTLFPLALGPELGELRQLAGGILWVAALLAALLGLEFLFRADHADGTLEQMLLSGQPLALLAIAKGAAHWTVCGLPLVLVSPLLAISLGVTADALCTVMLSLALGTGILSALGAIGAALTLSVRRGGLILALIVLPLLTPAVIFGAGAVLTALEGGGTAAFLFLAAFSLIAVLLSPFACAAAVRLNLAG